MLHIFVMKVPQMITQRNEIVLVGGSTRIPRIQKLLSDFFNGKKLEKGR